MFVAAFRFTIGRPTYSGSVEKLQIGFTTGILRGGAREAQTERILSKRHPKHRIKKDSKLVISWPHAKKSKILRVS